MAVYKPASEAHAVEQAIVGIRLLEPATENAFSNASRLADEITQSRDMKGRAPLDQLSVLTRQMISHGFSAGGPVFAGELFYSFNSRGQVTEEVMLERSLITYRTHQYKRWENVQEIIQAVMLPMLEALCEGDYTRIGVVELRCIDKFHADLDDVPVLGSLIRADCPYIAPCLLESSSLLHSHVGWFDYFNPSHRRLINVNIDLNEGPQGKRLASILQVISSQGEIRGSLFADSGDFAVKLNKNFDDLHQNDKCLLSKILTDELQSEINLKGSTGLGWL